MEPCCLFITVWNGMSELLEKKETMIDRNEPVLQRCRSIRYHDVRRAFISFRNLQRQTANLLHPDMLWWECRSGWSECRKRHLRDLVVYDRQVLSRPWLRQRSSEACTRFHQDVGLWHGGVLLDILRTRKRDGKKVVRVIRLWGTGEMYGDEIVAVLKLWTKNKFQIVFIHAAHL